MSNITFLSSCHFETGNCSSIELYKIIEGIAPDIIFEELNQNGYNDHYGEEGPYSTETKAIYKYLRNNNIQHIPVDTYDIKDLSKDDKKYMDNMIYNNSIEYQNLFNNQLKQLHLYGFKFLNSEECTSLMLELQKIENNIQEQLCDDKLTNIYKTWIRINNERENEMIKNIYNYCKANIINKGLLITGADHRNSLKNIIQNYKDNDIKINWNYWNN